jgi:hypothetical protein
VLKFNLKATAAEEVLGRLRDLLLRLSVAREPASSPAD